MLCACAEDAAYSTFDACICTSNPQIIYHFRGSLQRQTVGRSKRTMVDDLWCTEILCVLLVEVASSAVARVFFVPRRGP